MSKHGIPTKNLFETLRWLEESADHVVTPSWDRSKFVNAAEQIRQLMFARPGILQDWVAELGLRHQGCLMGAIRGPDNEEKEGPGKKLVRFYRACVLRAHVGDPRKAASFMAWTDDVGEFNKWSGKFMDSFDHYHNHFVLHFVHAVEICGYKMPSPHGDWWHAFYTRMCHKFHMVPETEAEMDTRLNATEQEFALRQRGAAG